jgi:uncharacterized protein
MILLFFGAVSLLYATVGQAGGTAFLAVMAMASFSPDEMRPTALLLNIVAAAYHHGGFTVAVQPTGVCLSRF